MRRAPVCRPGRLRCAFSSSPRYCTRSPRPRLGPFPAAIDRNIGVPDVTAEQLPEIERRLATALVETSDSLRTIGAMITTPTDEHSRAIAEDVGTLRIISQGVSAGLLLVLAG